MGIKITELPSTPVNDADYIPVANTQSGTRKVLMADVLDSANVNYEDLPDKPSINGIVLEGNTTTRALGLDNVFWAVYNVTTVAEIEAAYQAGKVILCNYNGFTYRHVRRVNANSHYFAVSPSPTVTYEISRNAYLWDSTTNNLVFPDLSTDFKTALLNCFQNVAWINDDGQTYYNALYDALYEVTSIRLSTYSLNLDGIGWEVQMWAETTPEGATVTWSSSDTSVVTVTSAGVVESVGYGSATITASAGNISATCSVVVAEKVVESITATYTQRGYVYPTTSLDSLKSDIVVTARWSDSTTTTVESSDYTLTGELVVGSSTITVNYGGKTTTFGVTVSPAPTLSSISAVYTQSGTVYTTDSLDSLKADLVVTATYSDSSTATVPAADYTLSGTLTEGTSTITVTYSGKTTTFTVTVTGYVPNIYQKVEYIQASGTQYIVTDYQTTYSDLLNTELTVDVLMPSSSTSKSAMIAAFNSYSGLWFGLMTNSKIGLGGSVSFEDVVPTNKNRISMHWTTWTDPTYIYNGYAVCGNETISRPNDGIASPLQFALFNAANNPTFPSAAKIYYAKLTENGETVMELFPVYRKSDGVIGMYDAIGRTFYTNSGTGTFIKGGDVA